MYYNLTKGDNTTVKGNVYNKFDQLISDSHGT